MWLFFKLILVFFLNVYVWLCAWWMCFFVVVYPNRKRNWSISKHQGQYHLSLCTVKHAATVFCFVFSKKSSSPFSETYHTHINKWANGSVPLSAVWNTLSLYCGFWLRGTKEALKPYHTKALTQSGSTPLLGRNLLQFCFIFQLDAMQ